MLCLGFFSPLSSQPLRKDPTKYIEVMLAIIFSFLFSHLQDVTDSSSDPILDLQVPLEELYTQNLLQRQDDSPPSVDLSMGPASGFIVNDYTPEQQYGCENTGLWAESHLPSEVISSAELTSLLPDSTGKVLF